MAGKLILMLGVAALLSSSAFAMHEDEFAQVTVRGKLHSNAREGRATIEANGAIYDLDLGEGRSLWRFAERHDRDRVTVTGSLRQLDGARGEAPRYMIVADKLEAVGSGEEVRYSREAPRTYTERPVVRERTIIKEKDPFFKVGPLEIGN